MDFEMFHNELKGKMIDINIELTDEQIKKFYDYMLLLLEWNEKINLTAITDEHEIILKHFVDSASINKYIENNKKVIDLGTGAGFPGIPLKIINEDIEIILVDSLNKRINFLNEVINKLKLSKIETIHARAEELARNSKYRESYDIAVSRAVAPLNVLVEYTMPFIKVGGKLISMKGSNAEEELKIGKRAIEVLGGTFKIIEPIKLPEVEDKRNIIIIDKVKETPKQYPRKAGTPSKKPII